MSFKHQNPQTSNFSQWLLSACWVPAECLLSACWFHCAATGKTHWNLHNDLTGPFIRLCDSLDVCSITLVLNREFLPAFFWHCAKQKCEERIAGNCSDRDRQSTWEEGRDMMYVRILHGRSWNDKPIWLTAFLAACVLYCLLKVLTVGSKANSQPMRLPRIVWIV